MPAHAGGRQIPSSDSGFTLFEAVLYVAILSLLFIVAAHTVIIARRAFDRSQAAHTLAAEGARAFSRILYEIRLADGVNEEASVLGASPGVLSLLTQASASDDTPTTRMVDVSSGVLRLYEMGGDPAALADGITVRELVFRAIHLPAQAGAHAIRVEMTAESSYKTFTDMRKFYGTAVLRGSY